MQRKEYSVRNTLVSLAYSGSNDGMYANCMSDGELNVGCVVVAEPAEVNTRDRDGLLALYEELKTNMWRTLTMFVRDQLEVRAASLGVELGFCQFNEGQLEGECSSCIFVKTCARANNEEQDLCQRDANLTVGKCETCPIGLSCVHSPMNPNGELNK